MFKSLIEFRGTTILKAFIINSIIVGIVAALTVETRNKLNEHMFNPYFPKEIHKVIVTMIVSFLISMVTYIIMRLLFGTYGGALDGKRIKNFL